MHRLFDLAACYYPDALPRFVAWIRWPDPASQNICDLRIHSHGQGRLPARMQAGCFGPTPCSASVKFLPPHRHFMRINAKNPLGHTLFMKIGYDLSDPRRITSCRMSQAA